MRRVACAFALAILPLAVAVPAAASDGCRIDPRQRLSENLLCAHATACDVVGIPYELVTGHPLYCR